LPGDPALACPGLALFEKTYGPRGLPNVAQCGPGRAPDGLYRGDLQSHAAAPGIMLCAGGTCACCMRRRGSSGALFLLAGVSMERRRTRPATRRLFFASLLYLPLALGADDRRSRRRGRLAQAAVPRGGSARRRRTKERRRETARVCRCPPRRPAVGFEHALAGASGRAALHRRCCPLGLTAVLRAPSLGDGRNVETYGFDLSIAWFRAIGWLPRDSPGTESRP